MGGGLPAPSTSVGCGQGELGVAERYLTRATSVSSGSGTAAKGKGEGRGRRDGVGDGDGPADDWLALLEFYLEMCPPSSARASDALVRKITKNGKRGVSSMTPINQTRSPRFRREG